MIVDLLSAVFLKQFTCMLVNGNGNYVKHLICCL